MLKHYWKVSPEVSDIIMGLKERCVSIRFPSHLPKLLQEVGWRALTGFQDYAEKMSPLGNASADDCAGYVAVLFRDLTRMVTMQNLFHDGGFSFTGVTEAVVKEIEKSHQTVV